MTHLQQALQGVLTQKQQLGAYRSGSGKISVALNEGTGKYTVLELEQEEKA